MKPSIWLIPLLVLLLGSTSTPANVAERTLNNGQLILQDVPEIPDALKARVAQYQNVRSAVFQDWTEDGNGIYIKTRFADTNQIHLVRSPGGARNQLTYFKEPIDEVVRQKQGKNVAFTMDRGGSEFTQIFVLDPKSGISRMVTDGASRNRQLKWDRQGKRLAYQTTRRNGKNNDVWIMDIDRPDSARPVFESDDGAWWGPGDFTVDGRYMLLQQYVSIEDSRIFLLDLETGEKTVLAGGDEEASANRISAVDPRKDGFYFVTNSRGFAAELAWRSLDPEGEIQYITTDIPWDVSEFAISHDGRRGAFVTNEEGLSKLYLMDTRRMRYKPVPNLPVGLIFGLSFNQDNRRLAFTMNTPQTPSDAFVLELARSRTSAKKLVRWTHSEVGGLDTDAFVAPSLIRYPTFDMVGEVQRRIPAFVYRPAGPGPHPVVIYIHGGPESQYRPAFSSTFQMWLGELGAAVIAPNVRGSVGYGYDYLVLDNGMNREDSVRDIGALLDWIAEQPDLDARRVAVYGGSYGGYMVLASAFKYGERLSAAVDIVGISNFVTFLENTQDYRRDLRRAEYGDERDPEMRAFLHSISPLTNVDQIEIPTMVVQGQNDPRVPVSQAEQIVEALRERQIPVWYMNALNEGHGYARKDNRDVYQQAAMLFLKRYLID